MIVVDASLAAKWFLPEADRATAIRFLRDHRRALAAPDLIFVEVASAIVRRANADKSLRADATTALRAWTATRPETIIEPYRVTPNRIHDAGRLAFDLGHPIADCIYLALAIELSCDLATCDTRFAAKANPIWPRVRLLADYATA